MKIAEKNFVFPRIYGIDPVSCREAVSHYGLIWFFLFEVITFGNN